MIAKLSRATRSILLLAWLVVSLTSSSTQAFQVTKAPRSTAVSCPPSIVARPQAANNDDEKISSSTSTSTSTRSGRTPRQFGDATSKALATFVMSCSLVLSTMASPVWADGQTKDFKLPPIDFSDKSRCTLSSSSMGQANAARDKLYDLRQCQLSGSDASGYDLSGVIMTKTDVSNSKFVESYFSKGYLHDSNFDGADFTNAIVDRASFAGSSLKGTIFTNAVLTGTSFVGADVENADFTDAYIGDFDTRNLCKNPTLQGENPKTGADTRMSLGCAN